MKLSAVTGDIYLKQEYGPVPSRADEIIAELKSEGRILTDVVPSRGNGRVQFELSPSATVDESVFSREQRELLDNICNEFSSWSREKIVNQTHLEAPWFFSKPFEIVDYEYAKDIDFFV